MSFEQIINYNTPSDFTFDANKISMVALAKLKYIPIPEQHFVQNFSSSTGFTFDTNKVEFNTGTLEQKDQTPANSVFGCNFSVLDSASGLNVKENWSDYVPTLTGTPVVTAGKLVCIGAGYGAHYDNAMLASAQGEIKFKYTPNYNGGPASNVNVVALVNPLSNNDRIVMTNSPSGNNLRITISNASGTAVVTALAIGGAWTAVLGTEYEFALNYDSVSGVVRLFIDGALHGTLSLGAWTNGGSATTLSIGSTDKIYNTAEGSFDDVILFNSVQHTAPYTSGYIVPQTVYAEAFTEMPQFAYGGEGVLDSFDGMTTTEVNAPKYVLNGLYWNGAAWATSDGSYAQASSEATVAANIDTLTPSDTLDIDIVFQASNIQSSISNLDVEYSGQLYATDNPTVVNNSGVFTDSLDTFSATYTEVGSDSVSFQLLVNEIPKYFNGTSSSWVTATLGLIAESNTESEIETNKGSLDLTNGRILKVNAILHSTDGTTTPDITQVYIAYGFQGVIPDTPLECFVYAYLKDIQADAKNGVLEIENEKTFSNNGTLVIANIQRADFDENGYVEISVIETESVSKKYNFRINYTDIDNCPQTSTLGDATVPNQTSANIADLTFE